jgi:hypothetical protein
MQEYYSIFCRRDKEVAGSISCLLGVDPDSNEDQPNNQAVLTCQGESTTLLLGKDSFVTNTFRFGLIPGRGGVLRFPIGERLEPILILELNVSCQQEMWGDFSSAFTNVPIH